MNHIYRIVWNHTSACYQAVTESATGPSKGSGKSRVKLATTASTAALCIASSFSYAGPTGGQVTAGSATITQSGTATTINQSSNKAAIDWTKFSVGANESVRFNQPSASALTLNRVTGTESSTILGSISANGQVFILNPNGVLFGAGSQVNVGGLTASTLRLDNANFMASNYKFTGDGNASVVNNGTITVAPGGTIALMAPLVQNTGTLSASGGRVLLAGAQGVTLNLQADGGLVAYTLDTGSAQALVDNGGLIEAGGGHVVLTAKGVDALSKAVVNHSGVIEAQTVSNKGGVIELLSDMQSGTLNVSGKLDASAPNGGDGGFVETSASSLKIAETATVTTAAAAGQTGMWLLDPTDFTIYASGGSLPPSSGVAAATLSASLGITNATIATSAAGAGNGDIFVNSAVNWSANKLTLSAHRNININADLNGSGTAKLALEYGQVTASGADSDYILGNGAKVNLPAGQNFNTKQGSSGGIKSYTVLTSLGSAGSTTRTDLQGINGNLSGNYVLGANINAADTRDWNSGKGWLPIGSLSGFGTGFSMTFSGQFHGLGHSISGLYINRPSSTGVALFAQTNETQIRDFGLANIEVIGGYFTAGLSARNRGSIISNVFVEGTVKGSGYVGGLVASNDGLYAPITVVRNSYATVDVYNSSQTTGGLIAYNQGVIENSYSTGSVNATGTFESQYMGGLVGGVRGAGSIRNSYTSSKLIYSGGNTIGALVGVYDNGFEPPAVGISNSYYDKDTSGTTFSSGGIGKTTAEMQQQATYVGWDFVNTWRIVEGSSYPLLRALTQGTITLNVTASNARKTYDGNTISTLADLQALPGGFSVTAGNTLANGDTLPALNDAGTGIWSGTLNVNGAGNTWAGARDAGTYAIVPSGLSSQKYAIVYINGALTIDPATLTAVGVSGSRVYDGTRLANWNDNTQLVGVLSGDQGNVSLTSGAGELASKNVGAQALISLGTLALSGTAAGNYQLGTTGSSWTIQPRPVDISVRKTYDTNSTFSSGFVITNGLVGGDAVPAISGTATTSSSNAGQYSSFNSNQLASSDPNYTANPLGAVVAIIDPAPLTAVGVSGSRDYDGTRVANWNDNTQLVGVLSGDQGNVGLASGTGVLATKNVGTQPLISVGTLALGGPAAGNYQLGTAGSSWTIQPRPVDISVTKTYDGNATFTGGFSASYGVIAGDTVNLTGSATVSSANAGGYTSFTNSSLVSSNPNYTVASQPGSRGQIVATIERAALSVASLGTRDFDGTTNANWSDNILLFGSLLPSDKGQVSVVSGTGVLAGKNVGIQPLLSVGTLTLGGNAASNYSLSAFGSRWTINPANLVIDGRADTKVFDGTVTANGTITKVGGQLFGADNISGGVMQFADANAGINKPVLVSGLMVNDGNNGLNYNLSYQASGTIERRPVVVAALPQTSYANPVGFGTGFDETLLIQPGWTVLKDGINGSRGLIGGDQVTGDVSILLPEGQFLSKYDIPPSGGTYPIVNDGLTAGNNYRITYIGNNLKVLPNPVTADLLRVILKTGDDAVKNFQTISKEAPQVIEKFADNWALSNAATGDLPLFFEGSGLTIPTGVAFRIFDQIAFAWEFNKKAVMPAAELFSTELAKSVWREDLAIYGEYSGMSDQSVKSVQSSSEKVIDLIELLKSASELNESLGKINWQSLAKDNSAAQKLIASGDVILGNDGVPKFSSKLGILLKPMLEAQAISAAGDSFKFLKDAGEFVLKNTAGT